MSYRTAGVHLHFSNTEAIYVPPWWPAGTVVMMDKIAGVLLTAFGKGLEDPRRRRLYGRAGEYRTPAAARASTARLEWRVPSAYVMRHPSVFMFACDVARYAYRLGLLFDGRDCPLDSAQHIINNCDSQAAFAYLEKHKELFTPILKGIYPHTDVWALLNEGAAKLTSEDVVGNWMLNSSDWAPHNNRDTMDFSKLELA